MRAIASLARAFVLDRRGATMVEYALLIAMIALAMLVAFAPLAEQVVAIWENTDQEVAGAARP
jgi:pilus assembly protein Flp/PilA